MLFIRVEERRFTWLCSDTRALMLDGRPMSGDVSVSDWRSTRVLTCPYEYCPLHLDHIQLEPRLQMLWSTNEPVNLRHVRYRETISLFGTYHPSDDS